MDSECIRHGVEFLPDFMTLYHADYIFRANSTFSFWAGLIGHGKMFSPILDFPDYGGVVGRVNVDFVPGYGVDKNDTIRK